MPTLTLIFEGDGQQTEAAHASQPGGLKRCMHATMFWTLGPSGMCYGMLQGTLRTREILHCAFVVMSIIIIIVIGS